MTLTHIFIFGGLSLILGWLQNSGLRLKLIFCASLLATYWLQPTTPIRNLDFWLPTSTILITVLVWAATREKRTDSTIPWRVDALLVTIVILSIALTRYLGPVCCLTATRPPPVTQVAMVLIVCAGAIAASGASARPRIFASFALILLVVIFAILKTDSLALALSAGLRRLQGQDVQLASPLDVRWLGFSYLAFRLLHVLRDFQLGKTHAFTLAEFVAYVLFFPALTAGPIDRSQRFIGDLRAAASLQPDALFEGGQRIFIGIFKKFALADSLAIIALNPANAAQTSSGLWAWVLLYAYALRIYLDFAGYTDIALGLGRWLGVRLPENFTSPYWKTNLTAFWNSWHITLAQWFRAYFFNPVTRALRSGTFNIPVWLIILVGQAGTMLLIGLWHGVTWNFAVWGLWHAIGLFAHNRWSEWMRPHLASIEQRVGLKRLISFMSWLITFHYVTLGWVWFALPETELAMNMFRKLLSF